MYYDGVHVSKKKATIEHPRKFALFTFSACRQHSKINLQSIYASNDHVSSVNYSILVGYRTAAPLFLLASKLFRILPR